MNPGLARAFIFDPGAVERPANLMGCRMDTRSPDGPRLMTPAQMAALVDAAFRSSHPLTFLDATVTTFKVFGRDSDAATVAWMGYLLNKGEVEALMSLRAAWRRGEARSPAEAARRAGRVRV